jgi:acyl-CoA synthetase (NDP forming)
MTHPGLRSLLAPRSIALVGVSDDSTSIGGAPLANLLRFGYDGDIHLVSRSKQQIAGRATVRSVADLPRGVDTAVLAVPRSAAATVLDECGRRGVRSAVVFSSGFAETGAGGEQDDLAATAARYQIALAGPNCLGLVNFADRVPLTFAMMEPDDPDGRPAAGLVAQSGAMTAGLTYAAHAAGLAVSGAISTGNEAVLGLEDYFEYFIEDPRTVVITLLAEQIRRPRQFRALAARARAAGKPVVLLHLGRSERGRQSAATHTGALSGDYAVIETVLRAEGVALVDGLDELIDVTQILARHPHPGPALAIATDSGAVKTFCSDRAEAEGLELAALHPDTVARLREGLPEFATATNPADLTAQGLNDPEIYTRGVAALLADPSVGSLLVATMIGSAEQTRAQADAVLRGARGHGKPVCYVLLGGGQPVPRDVAALIADAGVPLLRSPERALAALRRVAQRSVALVDAARLAPFPAAAPEGEAQGPGDRFAQPLSEHASKRFLAKHGIDVPSGVFTAPDPVAAAEAARYLGFPVALKAQAAGLVHKSDAGAVALGLASADEVAALAAAMAARLTGWPLEGFLLEAMAPRGLELIVGAQRDPAWGTTVLAGLGGVSAEALGDVVLLPARFDVETAVRALTSLRGAALLGEFRGRPSRDVQAAAALLVAVAGLMEADSSVDGIDINPVVLLEKSAGAIALDATVVRAAAQVPTS